jgi:hypothetical protein
VVKPSRRFVIFQRISTLTLIRYFFSVIPLFTLRLRVIFFFAFPGGGKGNIAKPRGNGWHLGQK